MIETPRSDTRHLVSLRRFCSGAKSSGVATMMPWTCSRRGSIEARRKVRTRLDTMVANGHPGAWARLRESATESKPPNGALGRAW